MALFNFKCRCTTSSKTLKFYTDHVIPAGIGISPGTYSNVDGYRFINIFVQFQQDAANEKPVNLGVIFSFSSLGEMGSRRYVNLCENLPAQQAINFIDVSGAGSWHGDPKISSYTVRLPVMGPYVNVYPFNKEPKERKISIWAYLTT
jgi:hypothetical protein